MVQAAPRVDMVDGATIPIPHHSPFTIHHSPFTIHHSPFTIHHSPFTIHHSPFTIHHSPFTIHPLAPKKSARSIFLLDRAPGAGDGIRLLVCLFFFQFSQALADFLQICLQILGLLLQNVAFLLGSRRCSSCGVVKRSSTPVGETTAEPTSSAATKALAAAKAPPEASAPPEAQPATAAAAETGVRKAWRRKTCAETSPAPCFCTLTQWACSISSWHNYTLLF